MQTDIRILNFNKENPKKKEEVFITRFLLNSDELKDCIPSDGINIFCREEPDFHLAFISNPDKNIGLELTKCYIVSDLKYTQIEDSLIKTCKAAIKELKENTVYTDLISSNDIIHIIFNHEIMVGGFENCDKKKIKKELKRLLSGIYDQHRKYIDRIEIRKRLFDFEKQVEVSSNMMFIVPKLNQLIEDPVIPCIKKKESALKKYKERNDNKNISQWWLCIYIPHDAYINPDGYLLPAEFESEYDRIFLSKIGFYGYGVKNIYKKSD